MNLSNREDLIATIATSMDSPDPEEQQAWQMAGSTITATVPTEGANISTTMDKLKNLKLGLLSYAVDAQLSTSRT